MAGGFLVEPVPDRMPHPSREAPVPVLRLGCFPSSGRGPMNRRQTKRLPHIHQAPARLTRNIRRRSDNLDVAHMPLLEVDAVGWWGGDFVAVSDAAENVDQPVAVAGEGVVVFADLADLKLNLFDAGEV